MNSHHWKIRFQSEIQRAEDARAAGNEGMARVCARRAAGIIVAEYLQARGLPEPGPSAYDRLRYLRQLPQTSDEVREVANHLLLRITPEHTLPIEADLIAETRRLAEILLGQNLP